MKISVLMSSINNLEAAGISVGLWGMFVLGYSIGLIDVSSLKNPIFIEAHFVGLTASLVIWTLTGMDKSRYTI